MTAKRRVIWLSDEAWQKVHERAAAFSLNPSAYIAKLIEWRQPGPAFVETGVRGLEVADLRLAPHDTSFVSFNPAPKPGKR